MSPAPHPRMHGLTHTHGGPDPVMLEWESTVPGPTEFGFYDGTETPGSVAAGPGVYGLTFSTSGSDVEVVAVQCYRPSGTGYIDVRLYLAGVIVSSGYTAASVAGWNEIPVGPYLLLPSTSYVAGFYTGAAPAQQTPGTWPITIGTVASTVGSTPGITPTDTTTNPVLVVSANEFFVGPVVRTRLGYALYGDAASAPGDVVVATTNKYGLAFTVNADNVVCSGVQFFTVAASQMRYVELWSAAGTLLGSGQGWNNDGGYHRLPIDPPVALTNGQSYTVCFYGYALGRNTSTTWPKTIVGAGSVTLATTPSSVGGRSSADLVSAPSTTSANEYFCAPVLEQTV